MATILVIEDDDSISELVALSLETVGFEVHTAPNASSGLDSLEGVDLVVLDLGLPDAQGMGLVPRISGKGIPVLILSARDSLKDKVGGLDAGAEDYVTKPFELLELIARVRAILRRRSRDGGALSVAGLDIDPGARRVRSGGREIELTRREFDLLLCLAEHRGMALSRDRILSLAWGYERDCETRTVDVHVQRLREKLGTRAIRTVPGIGYRLEVE
jgi:Response regulators consisting of a CheY-like receiver domain and a winged-helix DNA-binding domain